MVNRIEEKDNKSTSTKNDTSEPKDGTSVGEKIYRGVKGVGTRDYVYESLRNDVNKDNVIDVIKGFNKKSPKEHIMHNLADDDLHEGIASRVPKALLRKALEEGLQDTPEYKALADYYGATGGTSYDKNGNISNTDTFKLTKHCSDNKELEEGDEATKVDKMMEALIEAIEDKKAANSPSNMGGSLLSQLFNNLF